MNFEIEKKEFIFPHPLKQSTKNRVEFPFTGDGNLVEKITTSCGCTGGTVENGNIAVTYNAPNRQTDVAQKVVVWLKDNSPMEVINPQNGQKIKNMNKMHIELWIKGKVE